MSVAQAKNNTKALSVAEMMAAITDMQPRLRERAAETKQLRKVPQATIDELQDIGFFLALQPKRYGGLELTPQDFFRMQIALAEACMSTAWASGIIAVHAFQIALMDDRAQQAIWRDNIHTRVSSSDAAMGKLTVVDGGFKLRGRWG